ncbi:MAG: Dabb family protein [Blastocatellia bacterium]
MSIIHLAFFQWKPTLSEQELAALRQEFAALQAVIPDIKSFRWIRNNSTENLDKGFEEGICLEFDDAEARQRYLEHPAHVAFAQGTVIPALERGLDSVLVFDYET